MDFGEVIGYGTDFPSFWIGAADDRRRATARCTSRSPRRRGTAVDAFVRIAARRSAPRCCTSRGSGPSTTSTTTAAFVRDPDGNNVEAVCHTPARSERVRRWASWSRSSRGTCSAPSRRPTSSRASRRAAGSTSAQTAAATRAAQHDPRARPALGRRRDPARRRQGLVAALVGWRVGGDAGVYLGATAAIAGHICPVWTGFRGGKGVATAGGARLAVFPPYFPIYLISLLAPRSRQLAGHVRRRRDVGRVRGPVDRVRLDQRLGPTERRPHRLLGVSAG